MKQSKFLCIIGFSMLLIEPCIQSYDNNAPSHKDIGWNATLASISLRQWAVINTSAFAATSLYFLWVFSKASVHDAKFIAEAYPYARAWYDDLDCKYPEAHLHEKQFLQGALVSDKHMRWNYFYNQVYCHKAVLEAIDGICRKKEKSYLLSQDEVLFLAIQEFLVLLQAGHIENNHVVTTRAYSVGTIMALEALKIWYKEYALSELNRDFVGVSGQEKKMSSAWEQNVLGLELFALLLLQDPLRRHQYFDSYDFACQQADIDILEKMVLFYERYHRDKHVRTYLADWKDQFYDDPIECMFPEARCAMIRKEIERRKENHHAQ